MRHDEKMPCSEIMDEVIMINRKVLHLKKTLLFKIYNYLNSTKELMAIKMPEA